MDEKTLGTSIQKSQITCNSCYNTDTKKCRHTNVGPKLTWQPAGREWVQVDLGVTKLVTGLVVKGSHEGSLKYKVEYSEDGEEWRFVKDEENRENDKVRKIEIYGGII